MASHASWKDLERRHAKRMGGKRLWRPDFSDSQPDGESETDTWDTKAYARFSVVGLFVEAEKKYRDFTKGRRFHLCLFDRSRPRAGDFVLLRASDYSELVAAADVGRGLVDAFTEHNEPVGLIVAQGDVSKVEASLGRIRCTGFGDCACATCYPLES